MKITMNLFKQKFTTILLALSFLVGGIFTVNFALKTEAASQAVGDLTVDYPSSPLFNASNIAPGYEEVRTISVTNNGSVNHSFSIALDGAVGSLADVLQFEPRDFDTNSPIWNHTLSEIAASPDGFVVYSVITPGQTKKFNLAAILPISVGNAYQGKSVQTFGIILGSDSSFEYHEPFIPVFGPTGTTGTTAEGAAGAGAAAGLAGVSTIGRLAFGTTGGVAAGPEVTAPTVEQPKGTGEVAGATTETKGEATSNKIICYWWWILLIIFAIFLAIYGWLTYNKEIIFGWVWPIVAGIILYFLHLFLHRYYTPAKLCPYFVWFELGELLLYYIVIYYLRNREEEES